MWTCAARVELNNRGDTQLRSAVVDDHATLALVTMPNDQPCTAIVHRVLVATLECVGNVLLDELGEDRMTRAGPDMGIPLDRAHPVPISRMTHADFANGIRSGRCRARRAGRCGSHDLADAPLHVERDATLMSEVCPIPPSPHTTRPATPHRLTPRLHCRKRRRPNLQGRRLGD